MTGPDAAPTESQLELARLREFFQVCPVGLVAFDEDGTVHLANPAAVNLLVPTIGAGVLANIVEGLGPAWPELPALLADTVEGGTVRHAHRLEFSQGATSSWLSLTLVGADRGLHMLVVSDITSDVTTERSLSDREAQIATLFDSFDQAYCVAEMIVDDDGTPVDYRFLEANPLFEDMTGLPDPVGRTALELVPDLETYWVETYARVALEHETLRFEQGSEALGRWFDVFAMPIDDSPGRFALIFKDISEHHEWEEALSESEQFTRRVLDNLYAFVGVMEPDGMLIESNKAPLEAADLSLDDVVGKKIWDTYWWSHSEVERARLIDATERARAGEVVRYDAQVRVGDDALIWVDFQLSPLRDGKGTITHLIPSGLDLTDRKEAERQRAQLLEAERRARAQTELLLQNATRLAAAVTVDELAVAVISSLTSGLSLDDVSVDVVEGDELRVISSAAIEDSVDSRRFRFDEYRDGAPDRAMPGPEAIRSNAPVVLATAAEIEERFPAFAESLAGRRMGSLLATPLRGARGEVLGALVLVQAQQHWADDEMRALVQGFAQQTGLALERAQLFERVIDAQRKEHDIAVTLQQALLPDRIVTDPSLEIAADYRAGSKLLAVGGDWYDTFSWPGGTIGIVVGDVAGHDLAATASMGRLRAAIAALAPLIDPQPQAVLDALEHCASVTGSADFMTVACVLIDTTSGRMRYATAGHPPPIVVSPTGAATWLDGANTLPIGVDASVEHTEAEVILDPGSLIVLYTDGLIERPGEHIDRGLERLAGAAVRMATAPVPTVPAKLIAELTDDQAADDVVTVVARWQPIDDSRR